MQSAAGCFGKKKNWSSQHDWKCSLQIFNVQMIFLLQPPSLPLSHVPLGKQTHQHLFYVSSTSGWSWSTILLVYFFQSHLRVSVLLEGSLSRFPTWHWFSNWFFLVFSKATTLKSPRGVGYLTGKTPGMWRPCFSFSVSRNQFFWVFQREKYRAATPSYPWGICNPFTPFANLSLCIHLL